MAAAAEAVNEDVAADGQPIAGLPDALAQRLGVETAQRRARREQAEPL